MKKIIAVVATLFLIGRVLAQPPGGGPPGGAGGQGGFPGGPGGGGNSGHLYGKLVDSAGKGIGKASVFILKVSVGTDGKRKEMLVKGLATQGNGDFSAEDLPTNTLLKVKATMVGFSELDQDVTLKPPTIEKDLGKLSMTPKSKELEQVVVTASKPAMTMDMDKKVFNVSKDIVSAGGTGLDILKNVPSINVDIDGNITLRGGSPQIFVDGKPTLLTLDQIPSDAIESVEVISNPSAKYDASGGGAGILNIVLKKNRKTGYNGSIRTGIDSYGGLNEGASLNVRENKINVSADINYHGIRDRSKGSLTRTDYSTSPNTFLTENQLDTNRGHAMFGRLGLDYFITNKATLSLTGFMMHFGMGQTSNLKFSTDSLYSSGKVNQYSTEEIASSRSFNGRGLTLGFKQLFAKQKEEWTADASYFGGSGDNNSGYITNYYVPGNTSVLSSSQQQQIIGGGKDHNIVLQSDFTDPLTPHLTLEAGLRAALQGRLNINNNYTFDTDSGAYVLVPSAASNYKSNNNVYAAYATVASTIGKFSYKAGLRVESSNYSGTLLNSGQKFSNQYPLTLFPSLFLGQKFGDGEELQLSYTRRVNRPNFFQLVPYTDSSNKLNITRGNPELVPEFTQSLELSYLKTWHANTTLLGSIYYKHTDHLITGYVETDTTAGSTALINTYINAETSYSMGGELTLQLPVTKWWDLSANINAYKSKINVAAADAIPQQALWSWFGKLNNSFRLPDSWSVQLSGIYQAKSNLPVNSNNNQQPGPPNLNQSASQGYIKPYYEADLAVKKSLLKNKLSVMVSWNDILRSRKQDQVTYSTYLSQEYSRLRNPQVVRLSVTYNFGKIDASLFRRKNNNVQSEEQ
jgi:outer membrane receptor protein involved in Fe transport